MSKILIHIHSGPELKNKVTLGFLVALSAIKKGHDVTLFLAADGVHLFGGAKLGDRNFIDLYAASVALSQLSYGPIKKHKHNTRLVR